LIFEFEFEFDTIGFGFKTSDNSSVTGLETSQGSGGGIPFSNSVRSNF